MHNPTSCVNVSRAACILLPALAAAAPARAEPP
jgi:hypothetical protein